LVSAEDVDGCDIYKIEVPSSAGEPAMLIREMAVPQLGRLGASNILAISCSFAVAVRGAHAQIFDWTTSRSVGIQMRCMIDCSAAWLQQCDLYVMEAATQDVLVFRIPSVDGHIVRDDVFSADPIFHFRFPAFDRLGGMSLYPDAVYIQPSPDGGTGTGLCAAIINGYLTHIYTPDQPPQPDQCDSLPVVALATNLSHCLPDGTFNYRLELSQYERHRIQCCRIVGSHIFTLLTAESSESIYVCHTRWPQPANFMPSTSFASTSNRALFAWWKEVDIKPVYRASGLSASLPAVFDPLSGRLVALAYCDTQWNMNERDLLVVDFI